LASIDNRPVSVDRAEKVREVLADPKELAPRVFDDLREALGPEGKWVPIPNGPTPAALGGLAGPWAASNPTNVAVYPQQIPATTIDDHANQITAISAAKPEALALTYTRGDGLTVQALTAHLKSKLLAFSSRGPQQPPLRRVRRGRTLRPRGRSARHQRLELGRGRQARFTMKEVAVGIELP
jgi:hypothetical protein